MKKKASTKTSKGRRTKSSDKYLGQALLNRALSIIDSAVTGALIAGTPLEQLSSLLSHLFLYFASMRAENHEIAFRDWTQPDCDVWLQIHSLAEEYVEELPATIYGIGELNQLDYLRKECGVRPKRNLSEIEARQHAKKIYPLTRWLQMQLSAIDQITSTIVELAILVVWFKTQALDGEVDDQSFATAWQNPILVFQAYNEVLEDFIAKQ